ncbi:hypothetical protein LCGC14_1717590 [marine sediment metagenome]|uniref:JAB1/MPN/MOV34 metalloenzyme domain-containing protein n=1 Tax=marine sediment metagenome TaxID=412755 RepID=A0A0F9I106_9ZZZZ
MKKNKKIDPFNTPAVLTLKAYKRIIGYANRYANQNLNTSKWREVYGILIGAIKNDEKIIVKDAIPMVVGDRAGVKYENKQYVDMAQIDASVFERSIQDNKNDFIIGWFHTHPGFGFFYSPIDCLTQLGYQLPNPYALGLVFDHCEKESESHSLGIAGLRLKNPERGISSTYDLIELEYEFEQNLMNKEAKAVTKKVDKNIEKVLKELEFISEILRKKALAQLQRNYGLILVPKEDVIITHNEAEANADERYLYEWDPDFFKKSYRIPKFREKIEKMISAAYDELDDLIGKKDEIKFKVRKERLKKKIKTVLKKPNEWYDKLIDDFSKKIDLIYPFYDYLDTTERKVIEHFEERSSEYFKVLSELNKRIKLNLKDY